ncbi:galactoside 2-L-fucosyltransferase 1/2 [Microdochium nivale]|nr:galactoside 2-L-fucosyltransferase 1/2 [Microdochium nivale]
MAPQFDLPGDGVTRIMAAPPRLNLRRAASYQHDRGALSSTSARFNFNHLAFSPPPSPGLPPPLVTRRPRKLSNAPRPTRVFRFAFWVASLVAFLYVASLVARQFITGVPSVMNWALDNQDEYEMVGQDELPDFPTPIAVTDAHGRSKWTVFIPPAQDFPLSVQTYADMCAQCREVAAHVRELHGESLVKQQNTVGYYNRDSHFVDVAEAEARGLLPGAGKKWKLGGRSIEKPLIGETWDYLVEKPACKSSLTFVLESADAGLGTSLMMLWMAYGLAQKEDRAFFIDDTRWAYGRYTDMFQPPPPADCVPPPRHEMLPCPHSARHLLVSASTARDTFGMAFTTEYEDLTQDSVERERPLFNLARAGYEALFRLNKDDKPYVTQRIEELRAKSNQASNNDIANSTVVGVHVRHGDVHPVEYQYNGAYIPLTVYEERAQDAAVAYHNRKWAGSAEEAPRPLVVVASDDPRVYESSEFSGVLRAQERIKLAAKEPTAPKVLDKGVMHPFTEQAVGWEGGFFRVMFWNLGRPAISHTQKQLQQRQEPNLGPETTKLRAFMGRAYVMDLAVLGQASDVMVCTISAMGCRLLAVMMGWDRAMVNEQWVNIDGDYSWVAL